MVLTGYCDYLHHLQLDFLRMWEKSNGNRNSKVKAVLVVIEAKIQFTICNANCVVGQT